MIEPLLADEALITDFAAIHKRHEILDLWWLGQSGFLLQQAENWILIDPYLSDSLTKKYEGTDKPHVRISRRVIEPTKLAFAHVITSSHNHTDHFDPETLRSLLEVPRYRTIVVPTANLQLAHERLQGILTDRHPGIVGMDDGTHAERMPAGVKITGIASAHETVDRDAAGHCLYLGYIFELGWPEPWNVYHSGDTVLYDGMVEKLRPFNIDVAILPINGRSPERRVAGNLNGREAAWLAKEIGAKLVIPCHYDMFEFNTASPDEFVAECERLGQAYRVLRLGERWSSSELKG
jgi:L-ascorbate metabolism protein UlaG (beta-lactamase superfamily)